MSQTQVHGQAAAGAHPWRVALMWLVFLGPFFYLSYGTANALAAQRPGVPTLAFEWEHHIPFLAWTIIPYWTLNAFYVASLFVHRTPEGVNALGRQLVTAQVLAVSCFLVFPLRFGFARPQVDGLAGWLFDVLMGFDKPFNQAPSLHIALVVILWATYAPALRGLWRILFQGWFVLIALSVLTTFQHHFVDVPTGMLLGLVCLWLWPHKDSNARVESPWRVARWTSDRRRQRLGGWYALGCVIFLVGAGWGGALADMPWAWLLCWPAVSLALVSLNYLWVGSSGFQKDDSGQMRWAARLLLAPYLLAARLNARLWTARHAPAIDLGEGVHLGALHAAGAPSVPWRGVVDLCAELPAPRASRFSAYRCVPCLDLVAPSAEQLQEAAQSIETLRLEGPVLVCCALGYSRSVCAVVAWLVLTRRASGVDAAIEQVRVARPQLVLSVDHRQVLTELLNARGASA